MSEITGEVDYLNRKIKVTLKNHEGSLVRATLIGVHKTDIIWDTNKYPDKVYIIGRKDPVRAKQAAAVMRLFLNSIVSKEHGGAASDIVDETWTSEMIKAGHLRRPAERNLRDGGTVIVAATVVNAAKLDPDTQRKLWAQANLMTKVCKSLGHVVSYEKAKEYSKNAKTTLRALSQEK